VHDPIRWTNNNEAITWYKIFFAILGTFGRYVTNLRGAFVENVKKVQSQPILMGKGVNY
jgi:hypothetical protein